MAELLAQANIVVPPTDAAQPSSMTSYNFVVADGSVLLKDEHERTKHVKPLDFPDRTGFECFVNHFHLPFHGTRDSLLSCLSRAFKLQKDLAGFADRRFQVIVSISEHDCAIRFHEVRTNESWLAADLDGYASEAILVLFSNLA